MSLYSSGATCVLDADGYLSVSVTGGLSNIRYIRIRQNASDRRLNLAEFEVYEILNPDNIALAKTVTVHSASTFHFPRWLVDGNKTTGYFSPTKGTREWVMADRRRSCPF